MKLTLDALASLVSGEILRGGRVDSFSGIASLDEANETQIAFLGHEKYFDDFMQTRAGAVIVPAKLHKLPPEGIALVAVDDPSTAFGKLVELISEAQRQVTPGVSPQASVDSTCRFNADQVHIGPGAVVGGKVLIEDGVTISANCTVADNVVLEEGVFLHPNVVIREGCRIGARSILQPGCIIGSDGFGYQTLEDGSHRKIEQVGTVEIGPDCEIGANTTIDRARFGKTLIGRGCKIDNLVQIAHNVRIGDHSIVVAQAGIAGSTHLGRFCTIAAQAGIAGHLRLAEHITVGGQAGVLGNLEDASTAYWGIPARPIGPTKRAVAASFRVPELLKRVARLEKLLEEKSQ